MAAQVRVLRQRVKSVRSTQKITKAQEMIATSRIAKAQAKVAAAAAVLAGDHRCADGVGVRVDAGSPVAERAGGTQAGRHSVDHRGPWVVRWLQLGRDQGGRGTRCVAALAGQGAGDVRHRPKGSGLLHLPQPPVVGVVDRLLRAADLRRCRTGDARPCCRRSSPDPPERRRTATRASTRCTWCRRTSSR